MNTQRWWRRWRDLFTRTRRSTPKRAAGPCLRLECLEERTLLNAGPLDPSFGNGGIVQTNLPGAGDISIVRAVRQTDNKIVAAGTIGNSPDLNFALQRFNADGALDTTFGTAGSVETPLLTYNSNRLIGLALQADGKILEVGSAVGDFIVVRYNANGSVDASFGAGSGYVLTAFNGGVADAHAVAVQADGKIVVAGDAPVDATHAAFALARYNADGSLDSSFGNVGEMVTTFGSGTRGIAYDLAIQTDGRIVAAGEVEPAGGTVATLFSALARYNTDGSLDAGFGSGVGR